MKKSKLKLLEDADYDKQVERLSGLPKYPHLPAAQHEIRRALRRISEWDGDFIHKLISEVVDTATACPLPADLIQLAGAKRSRSQRSLGDPDCPRCHGSGLFFFTRRVEIAGVDPYDGDFAAVCTCRGGKP